LPPKRQGVTSAFPRESTAMAPHTHQYRLSLARTVTSSGVVSFAMTLASIPPRAS